LISTFEGVSSVGNSSDLDCFALIAFGFPGNGFQPSSAEINSDFRERTAYPALLTCLRLRVALTSDFRPLSRPSLAQIGAPTWPSLQFNRERISHEQHNR
jgi:hypothetical protein